MNEIRLKAANKIPAQQQLTPERSYLLPKRRSFKSWGTPASSVCKGKATTFREEKRTAATENTRKKEKTRGATRKQETERAGLRGSVTALITLQLGRLPLPNAPNCRAQAILPRTPCDVKLRRGGSGLPLGKRVLGSRKASKNGCAQHCSAVSLFSGS